MAALYMAALYYDGAGTMTVLPMTALPMTAPYYGGYGGTALS